MTQTLPKGFKQTQLGPIPQDWEIVELGEISDSFNNKRKPLSSMVRAKRKGCFPYYGANGPIDYIDDFLFNGEYLLIGEDGSVIKDNGTAYSVIVNTKFWCSNHAHVLKANSLIGNSVQFLKYLFDSKNITSYVTGAVQPKLNKRNLESITFPLPPLPQQQKIAQILSSLDDKIELLEKQNKTLENIGQAIFKSWFVDFEGFEDDLVESEMGMIPRGWKVGKVGDYIDFIVDNRGKTPPTILPGTDGIIPMIEINSLIGNGRNINIELIKKGVNEEIYNSWFRKGHPKRGDVLFSTVGSIGEIGLVYDEKICIAQNIVSLRPNIGGEYLYELLKNIKPKLLGLDISTVQPSIKLPHLLNFEILLPNDNIINNFIQKSKNISEKINKNKSQIQTLSDLRDSLLPRLMSGKVGV